MKSIRVIAVVGILVLGAVVPPLSSGSDVHGSKEKHFAETIVLVTGFEPFGQYDTNPAQVIAKTLNGQLIGGATVIGISVPVDFDESIAVVQRAIRQCNPVVVISIGLAAHIRLIHVENLGVNFKRDPNNGNTHSFFEVLDPFGPLIRVSSLPTESIVEAMHDAKIPARQSWFAGTYVCNALLYGVLGYLAEQNLSIKAGFLHVPLLASQSSGGMELETLLEATKIAIQVSLDELIENT